MLPNNTIEHSALADVILLEMSSYMAGVFDFDLDVDTVTVGDSDEDDIIEIDEVFML